MRATFVVLGTEVDAITPEQAIRRILELVESRTRGYVIFCTVSSVLSARRDDQVDKAIKGASLVAPDGMPLVWIGKKVEKRAVSRVYGPDFLLSLLGVTGGQLRHYFYGGTNGAADEMATRLRKRFADVKIVGSSSPPLELDPMEPDQKELDRINETGPDIVWVGLGHPKQEIWMHANRDRVNAPVLAGVGAAFDFLSGRKREAPQWMKRSGLQWLHRLLSEPRRLWRRYLIGNTVFIGLLLREWLFGRRKLPRN